MHRNAVVSVVEKNTCYNIRDSWSTLMLQIGMCSMNNWSYRTLYWGISLLSHTWYTCLSVILLEGLIDDEIHKQDT